ncbi:SDR family NAD(P)-dependent oxidoreductase [Tenggerimyces flavus]|uniref:SDR family NAD(P)-dependent oxidoreductase n=1 Tax=Tenggerimyces flavus TaxID=1708749 RepID=A0ABV7YD91_9ACTN|nr:SDR family oxidoreductase [Tenggerimyces flavus]MBM7787097.1 NAD(P)-dependent dehydrogenase (short-subunit alcohol dehydrogenase family) [Tenggerimyces flavus]
MLRFEGKAALVTGAAHGIGRAIAERLAGEGARVALADLDLAAAEALASELGGGAQAVRCDVTDDEDVRTAIGTAVEQLGGLDVLVNNAGQGSGVPFDEGDDAHWQQQLDLNLFGAVRCTRAALPQLLRGKGNVVSIGSVNGIAAFGDIAYSTAKAGLQNLVKNLTKQYGPRGLRFNVVAPGTIRTRNWDGREDMLRHLAQRLYPLRRVGEPADIAAAVAFLASDDASWISGITLPVEGGALSGPASSWSEEDSDD